MAVRTAKKAPSKAQERMKKKSREEEEDEEDDENEENEEEEDEDEPKGKSVKSKKEKKDEDEEEEDEDDEDSSIPVFTGKGLKSMRLAADWLEEEGQYTFQVKSAKYEKSKGEFPAQVTVVLKVIEAPRVADEPKNGWPSVTARFVVGLGQKKDEKAKQRVQIGLKEWSGFVFAAMGELDDDDELDVNEICKKVKGAEVNAMVVHSNDYQNLRKWSPVE